jgi:hypothetical protein
MTPKRPTDVNELAKMILDIATGEKPDRDHTPEESTRTGLRLTGNVLKQNGPLLVIK